MRLDKFVCKSTELDVGRALETIHRGGVCVNGEVVSDESTQVHANNVVTFRGEVLELRPFRYLLMHKREGTICSNVDEVYPSLLHSLEVERVSELHVAGRLDVDTTGLVLLTDDGRWTYDIITPSRRCPKVYRVGLSRELSEDLVEAFRLGIQLQGEAQLTQPAELEILAPREARLTLTEGKFHQVKRMFKAVRNRVITLHREQIGEVTLDVPPGKWRYLTDGEVKSLAGDRGD